MQRILRAVTLLSLSLLISCGEEEVDQGLYLSVVGSPTIIPASGTDCFEEDISASYFKMTNFEMTWERDDADFVLSFVKIEISGSKLGGDYTKLVDADDFYQYMTSTDGDELVGARLSVDGIATAIVREQCRSIVNEVAVVRTGSIPIDGIPVIENATNFDAQVKITVQGASVGTGTDNLGEEESVRATVKFKALYRAN